MKGEKTLERPREDGKARTAAVIRGIRVEMSEEAKRDLRRVEKVRWWRPRTHPRRWE